MSSSVTNSRASIAPHRARTTVVAAAARLLADLGQEQDRLVLWLPVCLGTGIVLYFAFPTEPPLAIGLGLAGSTLLALVAARRGIAAHAVASGLLAVAIGFLASQLTTRRMPPMPELPRKASLATGRIAAIDLLADGRRRLTLEEVAIAPAASAEAPVPTRRTLRIKLRADDASPLATGERVRVRAMLHPPASPDYPTGRDPQRDAFFSGLAGSGYALSPVQPVASVAAPGSVRRLREAIAARIVAVLPGPRGAIAATLLTGLSTAIPQADRDAFAASGLAHLLAVAGLHLGIVMGLTLTLVRMALAAWEWGALRLPNRQIAAIVALSVGAAYMVLTGLHLPGLRSLAMASIAMLALVVGRRAVTLRALAAASMLLLLANPASLLDVSYQMSFAAVMALLSGYEAIRPLMQHVQFGDRHRWRRVIALHGFQLFFTSLIAGTASLPYAAYHFGRVQFYFVLANLVAVPLTAFWVMPQGLLSLLLMPFGLEWVTLRQMGAGIDLILFLARTVAAFPQASLAVPASPGWGLLSVSVGLCWLCLWRRRWRLWGLLPLAFGLASPWLVAAPDLLVSGDARLIALHRSGGLLIEQASGADPLTLSDWRRAWAVTAPDGAFPDAGAAPNPAHVLVDDVVCNPVSCLITVHRRLVLLLRDGGARDHAEDAPSGLDPGDCDGVALLVSARPSHGACPGVPRIDRFTVWKQGPEAVWLSAGRVLVRSIGDGRGRRPWVPAAPVPHRARPTLPMALSE